MDWTLLTRTPEAKGVLRLLEESHDRGHRAVIVDTLDLSLRLGEGEPALLHQGVPLRTELVHPRFGPPLQATGVAWLRQLELLGVPTLNDSTGLVLARDKLASLQALHAVGLPVPRSAALASAGQLEAVLESVGGPPVVLKRLSSWKGTGVILADTPAAARSMIEALTDWSEPLLVQRYVAEAERRDRRVLVAGGRVLAAMERSAPDDDFRTNASRGGPTREVTLDSEVAGLCVKAVESLGLALGGVDLIEATDGPLVLEVNASPGFAHLEAATGRNLAGELLDVFQERIDQA
ncbi:MAG: RimK family alpha-L-glutamate ligase [Acidobacteriota bacterium]